MAAPDRKTGFLEKQGRGRNFSPYKPWARRMFDLDPSINTLTYSWEGSVKGRIGLDNDSEATRVAGAKPMFLVNGAGGEAVRCAARDAAEADAWVAAINRAVLGPAIVEAKAVMRAREVAEANAARQRAKEDAAAKMRAEREAMAKTRAAPAPRPKQRASVVRAQMDAANAILLGALDAYAVDKGARDPTAAELVQSRLVDAGGDGAASPGGRVVSREVSVHAEIDPSLDAGVRAARAGAAEKAERDAAAALAERTTAEREAAAAQATLARKFADAERREAEDRAKAAAVVEKLRGNLAKSKVTTHEERVHGLAEAGEENAVAQRIAAKMLAIKRAKGKDRARAAPAAPAALPDPFPESEGWL